MPRSPQRVWPLQGATNFRDLGGYPGHDGRPLRWRRIFRSDHLGGLTKADRAALAALGLGSAVDFRGVEERAAMPYELSGVRQLPLAIEPSVVQRMGELAAEGWPVDARLAVEAMKDLYRRLVDQQAHRYAALFRHLLETDAPVVFHCTAGKDRTGVAAALVLLALGVERDLVVQDFLLTNEHYRRPHTVSSDMPAEVADVLWNVQVDFIQTALQTIDDGHGGIDRYLRERIGLDGAARAALAARFLQDA